MASVIDSISARHTYSFHPSGPVNRYCAPFNVSTREPAAIEYWCRHFNTSPERLIEAVRKVGSNPDIIRMELRAR
jgi:hypothetical protein